MATMTRFRCQVAIRSTVLFVCAFFVSCASNNISPVRPPESYKGPLAEQPVLQQGDFWVYAAGNGTRTKSTRLIYNVGFPLWIGKTWSYDSESLVIGWSGPSSKASRIPVRTECSATAFKQVTVTAGTFEAFEFQCWCADIANRDRGCGEFTFWYAPEIKNIIGRKTESTASSFELVEYKASIPTPSVKATQGNLPVPPKTKFELNLPSLNAAVARGETKEALASYESQAREAEKNAAASLSPQQYWEIATSAYRYAASAASISGDPQKTITYGEKALEIAEKTKVPSHRLAALSQLILGFRLVKRFDKSREYLDKSVEILKEIPADTIPRIAWESVLQSELGQDFMGRQEYLKAIDAYVATIYWNESWLSRLEPGNRDIGVPRYNIILGLDWLGRAYRRASRLDDALQQYQRAFNSIKEWGVIYPFEDFLYLGMGDIYFQQKNYSVALESFQQALALAESQQTPRGIRFASVRIADILRLTGKLTEAIPYYRKTIQQIESTRSLLQATEDRQSYFAGATIFPYFPYTNLIRALTGLKVRELTGDANVEEAFHYSERARSRTFLDVLGNKALLSRVGSGLLEEERSLRERISRLTAVLTDQAEPAESAALAVQLRDADRAYNEFLAKIRKQDKEQASLMSVEPLTAKEVQQLLDPGTTLIEYFVALETIRIWIIGKDNVHYLMAPIPKRTLSSRVKNFRETIFALGDQKEFQEVSSALYQLLVQRALPFVKGRELIIVPHDVLHYLPFHALMSPKGRYLIEDYQIYYLSSASLLQFTKEKRRAMGDRVLAFGNPDLGDPKMNLQFAGIEAKEIKNLYPQSTIYLEREATEEKAKTLSLGNDIIHFASHAELNEDDPLSSAVLLTKTDKEDGRLEVREIFGMDLKASLVVLSACETGLGKLSSGDELVGLTRAFIYAGTPSVVASLWNVEDSSTAQLMASFYKNLKTMTKVEALRQAQLNLIRGHVNSDLLARRGIGGIGKLGETAAAKPIFDSNSPLASVSTSHPYFWAPFILVGDGK